MFITNKTKFNTIKESFYTVLVSIEGEFIHGDEKCSFKLEDTFDGEEEKTKVPGACPSATKMEIEEDFAVINEGFTISRQAESNFRRLDKNNEVL